MEFNVEASCIAISTSMIDGKIGVLSLDKETINIPSMSISEENSIDIEKYLIDFVKGFLSISAIFIYPQIISVNKKSDNCISINYGFLIPEQVSTHNSYWVEFNYNNPQTTYANIIAEVIQKLK